MKKILLIISFLISSSVGATQIASCNNLRGHGFYHHQGIVAKSNSGWVNERIKETQILKLLPDGNYDIQIINDNKNITSQKNGGHQIVLLRKGKTDISLLSVYPGGTIEIYTFWKDENGNLKMDLLQSKGGTQLFHKSSVLVGDCSEINFHLIK